jgi:hypothetical protein
MTIFEHAPKSHGAEDYMRLVETVMAVATRGQIGQPEMTLPAA